MIRKTTFLLICAILSIGAASGAGTPGPYTLHYEVKLKSDSFGDMGTRKLWVKGENMRWESHSADLELDLVKNKDGVFLIHPWDKVVAKYPEGSNRGNPRALLPGPVGSPKAFVKAINAKKHGQKKLNNQLCDVYTYSEPTTRSSCELWVGVESGKPVQLVMKSQKGKGDTITATYTKFVEGANVPDSLFDLPKGYAVRPMPERKVTSEKKESQPDSKKPG